jgi:transposase
MGLFKRGTKPSDRESVAANTRRTTRRQSSPAPLEIKLLALEALATGLSRREVAGMVGVATVTLSAWQHRYDTGGLPGLYRKPSSLAVKKSCTLLEQRIVAQRREHPEQGVRRIRDELRRGEALEVSAETVRTTVNEAGLGIPPRRRGPGRRRSAVSNDLCPMRCGRSTSSLSNSSGCTGSTSSGSSTTTPVSL